MWQLICPGSKHWWGGATNICLWKDWYGFVWKRLAPSVISHQMWTKTRWYTDPYAHRNSNLWVYLFVGKANVMLGLDCPVEIKLQTLLYCKKKGIWHSRACHQATNYKMKYVWPKNSLVQNGTSNTSTNKELPSKFRNKLFKTWPTTHDKHVQRLPYCGTGVCWYLLGMIWFHAMWIIMYVGQ